MLIYVYTYKNAGDVREADLIPELGRSPGEGHDNPLQYSCLENLMDRGAQQATVHKVAKSRIQQKRLGTHKHTCIYRYMYIYIYISIYICELSNSNDTRDKKEKFGLVTIRYSNYVPSLTVLFESEFVLVVNIYCKFQGNH